MKKYISLIMILLLLWSTLTMISCKKSIPQKSDFSLELIEPVLSVKVGEIVTYRAELHNLSSNTYWLEHGVPLISFIIGSDIPTENATVGATLAQSKLDAKGTISREMKTEFEESGDFFLKVFCAFQIGQENFYMEVGPIVVLVAE